MNPTPLELLAMEDKERLQVSISKLICNKFDNSALARESSLPEKR
jgi:hypothetical protein